MLRIIFLHFSRLCLFMAILCSHVKQTRDFCMSYSTVENSNFWAFDASGKDDWEHIAPAYIVPKVCPCKISGPVRTCSSSVQKVMFLNDVVDATGKRKNSICVEIGADSNTSHVQKYPVRSGHLVVYCSDKHKIEPGKVRTSRNGKVWCASCCNCYDVNERRGVKGGCLNPQHWCIASNWAQHVKQGSHQQFEEEAVSRKRPRSRRVYEETPVQQHRIGKGINCLMGSGIMSMARENMSVGRENTSVGSGIMSMGSGNMPVVHKITNSVIGLGIMPLYL